MRLCMSGGTHTRIIFIYAYVFAASSAPRRVSETLSPHHRGEPRLRERGTHTTPCWRAAVGGSRLNYRLDRILLFCCFSTRRKEMSERARHANPNPLISIHILWLLISSLLYTLRILGRFFVRHLVFLSFLIPAVHHLESFNGVAHSNHPCPYLYCGIDVLILI